MYCPTSQGACQKCRNIFFTLCCSLWGLTPCSYFFSGNRLSNRLSLANAVELQKRLSVVLKRKSLAASSPLVSPDDVKVDDVIVDDVISQVSCKYVRVQYPL